MIRMKKKAKRKNHKVFWIFVKLQMVLMALVLAALGYYYLGGYATEVQSLKAQAENMVKSSDESVFHPDQSSFIYDKDGNQLIKLTNGTDATYCRYEDIPSEVIEAITSIEDKKFFSHRGVDFKAIIRAVVAMLINGEPNQGGSTITMQLAKLTYLDNSITWQRKMSQIFCAMELEKLYSKEKILEFYLNDIYFANGYYGIQAACEGYFGCTLEEIDVSQAAFLCAIPNSPSYYDPLVNKKHTLERRNRILKNMYDDGKLSVEEYEDAIGKDITLNHVTNSRDWSKNYAATYSIHCATRTLMELQGFEFCYKFQSEEEQKAYEEAYDELYESCRNDLYAKGYTIRTTIDWEKQEQLQRALDEELKDFTEKNEEGIYSFQGSATCIDNTTGQVVAIVGGRSQDLSMYTLNRAFQSYRQSGSAIKPILDYAPAFERGYTPESIVVDEPIPDGPKNAGGSYAGEVTIRQAVEWSYNTIPWKLLEEMGVNTGLDYLRSMEFSGLKPEDEVLPVSIGGFTRGVSATEMAAAYGTLENDGGYRNPSCIASIEDSQGNLIYEATQQEKVVYKSTAARMMTDVLQSVMTDGLGQNMQLTSMPSAGKTGTTNDNKDGWFCGYTRYYTTAVWVGYDMPKTIEGLGGGTYPGAIWKKYMEEIHKDLQPIGFLPYPQLSQEFMEETGLEDNSSAEEPQEDPTGEQPVEEGTPENHVELQEEQPQQGLETIE